MADRGAEGPADARQDARLNGPFGQEAEVGFGSPSRLGPALTENPPTSSDRVTRAPRTLIHFGKTRAGSFSQSPGETRCLPVSSSYPTLLCGAGATRVRRKPNSMAPMGAHLS